MKIDIRGKINEKRLAYNNTLLPLYEAIVNSIHAIEEGSSTEIGLIEVEVVRNNQGELDYENKKLPEIVQFNIKDNGIGFNEKNYNSFNYAHSTYKIAKGGKGIGRFTWLRAFHKAEITSYYKESDKWFLRSFNFEPTINGIENEQLKEVSANVSRYTIVKLLNLKRDYRKWCNNDIKDIAYKIIEHCFVYFLNSNCPLIKIIDIDKTIIVNDLFKLYIREDVISRKIKIRDNEFDLKVVKIFNEKPDNRIHYCANNREVINDKISTVIPELDSLLYDDKLSEYYSIAVFVQGNYLDEIVNDERTSLSFANEGFEFPDQTTQTELRGKICDEVQMFFKENINTLSLLRITKIENFVHEHPRYKQLLKYRKNDLIRIPSNLSDDKLEIELFKVQQSLDLEVKEDANKVLKFIETEKDKEEFIAENQELYNKIIEVGNSKLSEYVIHRKLVLDLFDKFLKSKATEKAVHNLIFPLQTLSDEIGFEDHNLWIIDERLSYHKYLASDKKFKKIEPLESESLERPDIIIFNKPFAFVNDDKPYQSIVLIEFKRPNRNDYNDEENPISQINRYAREIKKNIAKDKYDREFNLTSTTPIYAYIICDLTQKLIDQAIDNGYKNLPAGNGFFSYNENHNMYIEIQSFDKILKDSRDRNKVLFDKLNL